jgi:precorrin-2 dehydrogenase/sirohydrochlorin ferrochelatase
MSFYPICLDLEAKRCIVVGGGNVAERKIQGLLSCSAQVIVISPELTDRLKLQHADGMIEWLARGYQQGDLAHAFLVIAATDDEKIQKLVYQEATTNNLLLNVADVPHRCNFILPATARQGDLSVSVSTGGKSPALARKIRMELEKRYGPEYRILVDILGGLRPEILDSGLPQQENEQLFTRLLHDDLGEWIKHKDRARIEKHFLAVLEDKIGNGWLPVLQSLLDEDHIN